MKKFFVFLPLFLTSFFLFSFKVNATDYTYNFNPSLYDFITSSDFPDLINMFNDKYYIIFKRSNGNLFYSSDNPVTFYCSSWLGTLNCNANTSVILSSFSFPPYSLTSTFSSSLSTPHDFISSDGFIIATNYSLQLNDNNSYTFSDGTNSYSCSRSLGDCSIPTLLDFYTMFYGSPISPDPPAPVDETPLLTSFIDISLDKLSYICEFFTSSYVYLSIFTVFLLYFVILLFRRFR